MHRQVQILKQIEERNKQAVADLTAAKKAAIAKALADAYDPDKRREKLGPPKELLLERAFWRQMQLGKVAHAQGLFLRLAPVAYRLPEGGVMDVGRTSEKLSRRPDYSGYVVIFHDPATIKIEFALDQDEA